MNLDINPVISRAEQYLDDPAQMTRFRAGLLTALRDPGYSVHRIFNWTRFAQEFTAPDFDPPLDSYFFLNFLVHPHFALTWDRPPRSRTWWLLRLVEDVEEPVIWLHQQRVHRGTLTQIAGKLNVPRRQLYMFLQRHKHPPIPIRFQIEGERVLVLAQSNPAAVWGLVCRTVRGKPAWHVNFCDPLPLFKYHQRYVILKQPYPALRPTVEIILAQHDFQPNVMLFYTGMFISQATGRLIRDSSWDNEDIDRARGPQLVEGWDEEGWPVGWRLVVKELRKNDN